MTGSDTPYPFETPQDRRHLIQIIVDGTFDEYPPEVMYPDAIEPLDTGSDTVSDEPTVTGIQASLRNAGVVPGSEDYEQLNLLDISDDVHRSLGGGLQTLHELGYVPAVPVGGEIRQRQVIRGGVPHTRLEHTGTNKFLEFPVDERSHARNIEAGRIRLENGEGRNIKPDKKNKAS